MALSREAKTQLILWFGIIDFIVIAAVVYFFFLNGSDGLGGNACPQLHLTKTPACTASHENNTHVYEATGTPVEKTCRIFLLSLGSLDHELNPPHEVVNAPENNTPGKNCHLDEPSHWDSVYCPTGFGQTGDTCFYCNVLPSGQTQRYYKLISFSQDCQSGSYWSSTDVPPSQRFGEPTPTETAY